MRTRQIIVGTDGTTSSNAAVQWAAREAHRGNRLLRIVHVFDWDQQETRDHAGTEYADIVWRHAALEDLLLRLGRLAEDLPEVAELDLNPVLAGPDGVVAVDANLRLAPVGAEPDPMLRRLRAADLP
jgi:nucleotide-binding universal stress UspA family protein